MNAMAWAWMVSREMEPLPRIVLLALAARADNHTFECWPSIMRIATDANVSESTVKRALGTLVAAGLVAKVPRPGRDGERDQSNVYRLAARMAFYKPDGTGIEDGVHTDPHTGFSQTPSGVLTDPLNLSKGTIPQKATPSSVARAKAKTACPD